MSYMVPAYVGLTSKQANNKLLPGHGSLGHCLHHADLLLLFVQLVFKKGKERDSQFGLKAHVVGS